MRHTLLLLIYVLITGCTPSPSFHPSPTSKKLISYGADWPNTAYVRANIATMEKRPYNGIVIGVSEERTPTLNGSTMGNRMWTSKRYKPEDYDHAIADLRATPFKKFTDNFIQVESMPGEVDLLDPEWDSVLHNIKILSRVARQGGCVGLEIDPEEYGYPVWTWAKWPADRKARGTEEQYITQARVRGRQFMRAINSEFPAVKILFLFGPTITASSLDTGGNDYRLLLPFIDGMCQTADEGTQIIDGYEFSYGYRTLVAFEEARKRILSARNYFEDKQAFDRVMRVGFGLWTDNNSGKLSWYPNEPLKNHFQPDTWQTAVYGALSYSDQYVWCWREQFSAWSGKNYSPDYEAAQIAGRSSPGKMIAQQRDPAENKKKFIQRAADQPAHDDATTFGNTPALYAFPTTGWLFRPDPKNVGVKQNWFSPTLNPEPRTLNPSWSPIEIAKFWEELGWDYDGYAWYRRDFKLDHLPQGKHIDLVIGSADESATVWINGQKVGTHDLGEAGWDQRFSLDATRFLRQGQNQITIRVLDRTGPGGLWKGIRLVVRD